MAGAPAPVVAARKNNASTSGPPAGGTRPESFESKGKRGGPNGGNNNSAATRAAIYGNPLPLYLFNATTTTNNNDTTLALLYSLTWSLSLSCQAIAASIRAKEHSRNRLNQKNAYIPNQKMQGYWDEYTKSVWVLPTMKKRGKRRTGKEGGKSIKETKLHRRKAVVDDGFNGSAEASTSAASSASDARASSSALNDQQVKDVEEPTPWMDYLWKRGFFGKGSLSRSEPTWWQREKNRVTGEHVPTAEDITTARRAERKVVKLQKAQERADEREKQATALSEKKKLEEEAYPGRAMSSEAKATGKGDRASALANPSEGTPTEGSKVKQEESDTSPSIMPPQSDRNSQQAQERSILQKSKLPSVAKAAEAQQAKMAELQIEVPNLEHTQLQREEALFLVMCTASLEVLRAVQSRTQYITDIVSSSTSSTSEEGEGEEDSERDEEPIELNTLWLLFARSSLGTAARLAAAEDGSRLRLRPDNPFIVSYIVYHHYRSLGWVVRNGIKFCADWVLYKGADGTKDMRGGAGPVGGHAEFAIVAIPTYEDPADAPSNAALKYRRDWRWLNTVNRVCSGVKKTVILTYVTIPRLSDQAFDPQGNLVDWNSPACLKHYKIREVSLKRFIPTRMRD